MAQNPSAWHLCGSFAATFLTRCLFAEYFWEMLQEMHDETWHIFGQFWTGAWDFYSFTAKCRQYVCVKFHTLSHKYSWRCSAEVDSAPQNWHLFDGRVAVHLGAANSLKPVALMCASVHTLECNLPHPLARPPHIHWARPSTYPLGHTAHTTGNATIRVPMELLYFFFTEVCGDVHGSVHGFLEHRLQDLLSQITKGTHGIAQHFQWTLRQLRVFFHVFSLCLSQIVACL